VRQLEQWGAIRKIWVRGDRKDYYMADDWLGHILKNAILDTVGKKLDGYGSLLDDVERQLASTPADGNGRGKFLRERVQQLKSFQRKTRRLWNTPLVKMMLR
jgi:DNA-binding transcriptional regulator GbsR (MarR family)